MTFHQANGLRALAPVVSAPDPPAAAAMTGGAYGWLTPYIAALAARNARIAACALTLKRRELHFIGLCLALMGDKRDDADHFAAFAADYGRLPQRSVLANHIDPSGPAYSPKVVTLASRLAGAPWRVNGYRKLEALFSESHARKTLRHMPAITRRTVAILWRLPPEYRTTGVLKMVRRRRDLSEVIFAIEIVRRVRIDLDDRQIIASLEKADGGYIREWVMRHYERIPFPEPPTPALVIDGVEALRPLACFDALAEAAREFDNCIRDYLWRVLKGDTYFYRYAPKAGEKGVAIVELRRAPVIGWVVHEALGPKNDAIKGAERAAILSAFRKAGVGAAPQAVNPDAWFDLG
ncbi:hypothetical protein [Hyphococcus sp.]|uniref:hypothetical protein n=1 Tax=Hyphococcus sp. TaxID=2038636 RepID=UPI0035C7318E